MQLLGIHPVDEAAVGSLVRSGEDVHHGYTWGVPPLIGASYSLTLRFRLPASVYCCWAMDDVVVIAPENPGTGTIEVPVLKVFDGDGFLTRIRRREFTGNQDDHTEFEAAIRFGFIDAPELRQPGGREAKDFLASLISDQTVELVVLKKMDTGRLVDRYGRIVCVPYLTQEYSGGEFRTSANRLHRAKTLGGRLLVTRNIELNGFEWLGMGA